jgi:putative nucleotidyltransferase with HDIG domain
MDKETAEKLLLWAGNKNPGKWIQHSYNVAKAAGIIAKECSLDYNLAYILGLLHDIGRYEGITNLRHVIAGYKLMQEKGYNAVARICLTHSFPDKNIGSFPGKIECTTDEINYIKNELERIEYDDYDKLIQLCDSLGSSDGLTIIEMRIVDVVRRYGFNEHTLKKWDVIFAIKKYFDEKCNKNIYGLFEEELVKNIAGKSTPNCT